LLSYRIEYSPDALDHLRAPTARQRTTLFEAVDRHLNLQPTQVTRNRKPMRPNTLAVWELRVGNLRVYYDLEEEPEQAIFIRAVGIKLRNCLRIGGKEIDL
jgi:mRNA-degrading endonuclease RelE of RelBE toxin-antitoxin system